MIPILLTILAVDPCAAWDHAQASFEMARRRVWWVSVTLDPIYSLENTWSDPQIKELEGWTLIEHPGETFAWRGNTLAGVIDAETKIIEYARASNLLPLAHEFAHWIHYAHPWPYGTFWQFTGHGGLFGVGSLDIFTHTLWVQMCDMLYSPFCEVGHQYSPQWLFSYRMRTMPPPDWCAVQTMAQSAPTPARPPRSGTGRGAGNGLASEGSEKGTQ